MKITGEIGENLKGTDPSKKNNRFRTRSIPKTPAFSPKKASIREEKLRELLKPLPTFSQNRKRQNDFSTENAFRYNSLYSRPVSDQMELSEGVSLIEGGKTITSFNPKNQKETQSMNLTTASDFNSRNTRITKKDFMMLTHQGGFHSTGPPDIAKLHEEDRITMSEKFRNKTRSNTQMNGFSPKNREKSGMATSIFKFKAPNTPKADGNQMAGTLTTEFPKVEEEKSRENEIKTVFVKSSVLYDALMSPTSDLNILKRTMEVPNREKPQKKPVMNAWDVFSQTNVEFNKGILLKKTDFVGSFDRSSHKAQTQKKMPKDFDQGMFEGTIQKKSQIRQRVQESLVNWKALGQFDRRKQELPKLASPKPRRTLGQGFFNE